MKMLAHFVEFYLVMRVKCFIFLKLEANGFIPKPVFLFRFLMIMFMYKPPFFS